MSPEQRERFLANIDADARRLTRLVQRLLELARADVLQPTRERVALAPALEAIAARMRAEGRKLTVSVAPDVEAMGMSAATLEAVMENVIDNTFQTAVPT